MYLQIMLSICLYVYIYICIFVQVFLCFRSKIVLFKNLGFWSKASACLNRVASGVKEWGVGLKEL